ncbi:hypothetical protein [Lentiprolixibacter aurantiacus]|uniref:RND transporter n=1 Tax=Lentiprolixibacter aurantiacus TaxID=2993939 RepID=A0AAE3SN34_9FLAO|nr:hypothetical protein [Lentiprolixibacter aurantiacus]MCX2719307.1 hypothetical protein [Lentiprolixibacter aurantiacus]
MKFLNDWKLLILLCLTLGLAPYVPEPHIWGKIRWLAGGAKGMQPIDYFDVVLHGTPFILLLRFLFLKLIRKKQG